MCNHWIAILSSAVKEGDKLQSIVELGKTDNRETETLRVQQSVVFSYLNLLSWCIFCSGLGWWGWKQGGGWRWAPPEQSRPGTTTPRRMETLSGLKTWHMTEINTWIIEVLYKLHSFALTLHSKVLVTWYGGGGGTGRPIAIVIDCNYSKVIGDSFS